VKGFNSDVEIEVLGPPRSSEVKPLIKQIREEGANYINVPPYRGEWPFYTAGRDAMSGQAAAGAREADHSNCSGGT